MKLKKFFLIPVVFISVLISTLCMSAFAGGDYEVMGGGNNVYYPLTDCISNYAPQYAHSYFYINYETTYEDSGVIYHKPWTMFIPISDEATYSNNNGVITVPREYLNPAYYYDFEYWTRLDGSFYSQDGPTYLFDGYEFSTDLVFNENLSQISFNGLTLTNAQIVAAEYDFAGIHNKRSVINVSFTPALVGQVDRTITTSSGNKALTQDLIFNISNSGNSACQYQWYIVAKNQNTHRGDSFSPATYFDDDPVYKYYTEEWVYSQVKELQISQKKDFFDKLLSAVTPWSNDNDEEPSKYPFKQNKATDWHYLGAGSSQTQTIHFSQINLKQGVEYTVVVKAVDCPYDYASLISPEDNVDTSSLLCEINFHNAQVVYTSDFTMLQYDDIVYDPNDDSNGIIPYNGYEGNYQGILYDNSYQAIENPDGSIEYKSFEYKQNDNDNFFSGSNSQNNNTKYNTVLSQSTSVLSFFGTVLGFFPSDVFVIFNIALWLALIIFVVRRLT